IFRSASFSFLILECAPLACVPTVSSELAIDSALPVDAHAFILAIADPRAEDPDAIRVWAFDRGAGFPRDQALTVDETQKLYAVAYRESLKALQLAPGALAPDPLSRRALPSGYEALLAAPIEGGALAWKPVTEIPSALTAFPFPSFDRRQCTIDQGCY